MEHGSLLSLITETILRLDHLHTSEERQRYLLLHILATSQSMVIRECDNFTLNIAISKDRCDEYVFQTTGNVVLFCVQEPFEVCVHRVDLDQESISVGEQITVTKKNPLLVDGNKFVYHIKNKSTLFGLINIPDEATGNFYDLDINVYSLKTRKKAFWFPYNGSVSRYLFVLKALKDIEDPLLLPIAQRLLEHPSPIVASSARQSIYSQKTHGNTVKKENGNKVVEPSLSLGEFVNSLEKIEHLDCIDVEKYISDLLYLLSKNPTLLGDFIENEIKEKGFEYEEVYNQFLFNLYQSPRFFIRLTFWEPLNSDIEKPTFIYGMKHNHDFKLFTITYSGDGYSTAIAKIDASPTSIIEGEPVNLVQEKYVTLPKSHATIMNAYTDIHEQFPPKTLSSSLCIIIPDERRYPSWDFDDNYRAKSSGIAHIEYQIYNKIRCLLG